MNPKISRRQKAVLYLERNSLVLFLPEKPSVLSLEFPKEIVRVGDILDKAKFLSLVQNFIVSNGVQSVNINIVVAQSLLFVKDILLPLPSGTLPTPSTIQTPVKNENQSVLKQPDIPQQRVIQEKKSPQLSSAELAARDQQEKAQVLEFVEKVPFEHVFYKILKLPTGVRVFATNGDFLESLQKAFFMNNCIIESALPAGVFVPGISFQQGLTVDIARQVLLKQDSMKQYNLFETPKPVAASEEHVLPLNIPAKHAKNLRLYAMLGVFGVLVVVLIIVFVMTNEANKIPPKKAKPALPPAVSTVTLIPTISSSSSSTSAVFSQSTSVHIISRAGTAQQASLLQQEFEELGIRQITIESGAASSASTIQFSPTIPQNAQTEIVSRVKEYIPLVVTAQTADTTYDIVVSF